MLPYSIISPRVHYTSSPLQVQGSVTSSRLHYKLTLPKKESIENIGREAAEFANILYTIPIQVQGSGTSPRFEYKHTLPKKESIKKNIGREAAEFATILYVTPI